MNKIYYLFAGVNGVGKETQDLNNLVKIIPFCDIINIYDNTGSND